MSPFLPCSSCPEWVLFRLLIARFDCRTCRYGLPCRKFYPCQPRLAPFRVASPCRLSVVAAAASTLKQISQHGIVVILSFRIGSRSKCLIDGRPIIKSVVTYLHTKTLKHICFWAPSTLDVNDTVTFITPSTPNDRHPTPLISVTLAFGISLPSFLIAAAIYAR